jgi:hypothetical protein
MRVLMLSSVVALGLGLVGMTSSFATTAAPVNATLLGAANQTSLVQKAWFNRYGQWCARRCNWRGRCWIICR